MHICLSSTYTDANTSCKREYESGFQDRVKEMEAKRKGLVKKKIEVAHDRR